MQFINTLVLLATCATAIAMPAAEAELASRDDNAPRIDVGVQKQDADGKNHWVVWKGGVGSVCSIYKVLDHGPCNVEFEIDGFKGKLKECNADGIPESLYGSGGTRIRQCVTDHQTIDCHHTHDILKRTTC